MEHGMELGAGRNKVGQQFIILRHFLFQVAVRGGGEGGGLGDASSVRLEYRWNFSLKFVFLSTSIAAYGVTPHSKSVSTWTGQDRPRPRFPAGTNQKTDHMRHITPVTHHGMIQWRWKAATSTGSPQNTPCGSAGGLSVSSSERRHPLSGFRA